MSHAKIEDMHDTPATSYRKLCRKTIKFILLFTLKGFKGPKDSSIDLIVPPQDSWPTDTTCQGLPAASWFSKDSFSGYFIHVHKSAANYFLALLRPSHYLSLCLHELPHASGFSSFFLSHVAPTTRWFVIQNFGGFLRCPRMWRRSRWPRHIENATPKPGQSGLNLNTAHDPMSRELQPHFELDP